MDEHRRVLRVTPLQALSARIGDEQAYVLDLSLTGLRVCHQHFLSVGKDVVVLFEWDGQPIEATAVVRWSRLQRVGTAAFARSLYESGSQILLASESSRAALRQCIEAHVVRALDEQKANANGIPPFAARSFQNARAERFARHEYVNGIWRKSFTAEPHQPLQGFTIAAEQPRGAVQLLREAYAVADPSIRELIRKMAEISILNQEPIPIRKYDP